MSAHGPDERLSAFYDGELSAVEREEVERQLAASADLRGELSALSDLSQRLSDLADDLPPVDLRAAVLQRLPSLEIPAPRPLLSPTRKRRFWMPVFLAVSSLVLLAAVIFPLIPSSNDESMLAMNDKSAVPPVFDGAVSDSPMVSAPMSVSDLKSESMLNRRNGGGASDSAPSLMVESDTKSLSMAEPDGAGPSEFLADLERRRGLKPGEIVSHLVNSSEGLLLVEFTVVDVHRGAAEFEVLLKQNGIIPIGEGRSSSEPTVVKNTPVMGDIDTPLKAILVDSETNALNTAIIDTQRLQDVVTWKVEPILFAMDEEYAQSDRAGQESGEEVPQNLAKLNTPSPPPLVASESPVNSALVSRKPAAANSPAKDAQGGLSASGSLPVTDPGAKEVASMKKAEAAVENTAIPAFPQHHRESVEFVNGNSLELPHGVEVVAELQQIQQIPEQRRGRAWPTHDNGKSDDRADSLPFPQSMPKAQPQDLKRAAQSESIARIQKPENTVRNGTNMFQNNYNTLSNYRSRQRALLVLRSQPTPPPPPEASPTDK